MSESKNSNSDKKVILINDDTIAVFLTYHELHLLMGVMDGSSGCDKDADLTDPEDPNYTSEYAPRIVTGKQNCNRIIIN